MENERNHNDAVADFMLLCHDTNIVLDVTSTGVLQMIGKNSKTYFRNVKSTLNSLKIYYANRSFHK